MYIYIFYIWPHYATENMDLYSTIYEKRQL